MSERLKAHQIAQSGATDGQGLLWDNAAGKWVPATVATASKVPLTTVVNGVPDFVWDENDELVHTEVPL